MRNPTLVKVLTITANIIITKLQFTVAAQLRTNRLVILGPDMRPNPVVNQGNKCHATQCCAHHHADT